jgi:hypothetical protein
LWDNRKTGKKSHKQILSSDFHGCLKMSTFDWLLAVLQMLFLMRHITNAAAISTTAPTYPFQELAHVRVHMLALSPMHSH